MTLKKCPECKKEVSSSAKQCPNCGKKLTSEEDIISGIFAIIIIVGFICYHVINKDQNLSSPQRSSAVTSEKIEYQKENIGTLMYKLRNNPAKTQQEYKGKYVEIFGKIDHIDSDGDSFSIATGEFLSDIHCYIHNSNHTQVLFNKNIGSSIKVRGIVKSVGNILGYSIDVIELE